MILTEFTSDDDDEFQAWRAPPGVRGNIRRICWQIIRNHTTIEGVMTDGFATY